MPKRIKDLEAEIEKWKEHVDYASRRCSEMEQAADKAFENSALRKSMQKEIDLLKFYEKTSQDSVRLAEVELSRVRKGAQQVIEDNTALCARHNIKYWVGITRNWDEVTGKASVDRLERRIATLEGELQAKDQIIAYLRGVLQDTVYKDAEEYEEITDLGEKQHQRGRPETIDAETRKRIHKLRKDGFSIRKIAEIEGVSPGSVQRIVGSKSKLKEKD